jgi:Uma2 family endonuclease
MTVAEFERWEPEFDLQDRRWELVDGEPVCMAPPSIDHAMIQSETARLIGNHLAAERPRCRIAVTPGVIPRAQSATNERVPDLGVTCASIATSRTLPDPLLLIEILSPSNEAKTRANVWAYVSIPTVREILLLSSTAIRAELLRRAEDGAWPEMPEVVADARPLRLQSIGFTVTLRDLYATSSLDQPNGVPR